MESLTEVERVINYLWCEEVDDTITHTLKCDGTEEENDKNNIWKYCRYLIKKYQKCCQQEIQVPT